MKKYNQTLYASYIGYITQAIVNNFAPLLFITFKNTYGIPLERIALLITANFGFQLLIDLFSAKFADRIGYRKMVVFAHVFCAAGMVLLGILPNVLPNPMLGLVIATTLYAIGGGVIEVIISPIVENCPSERKAAAMSILHSFYCWGQMAVILLSTLFFVVFGYENWSVLACVWAIVPLLNSIYFLFVPIIEPKEQEAESAGFRQLFSMKLFWIFALLMVCAGASELTMSQWASAFAEDGLHVSKAMGDLAGPCLFAVFMGASRVYYAKKSHVVSLKSFMTGSAVLCVISYLLASLSNIPILGLIGCALCGLSVGIMWPGTYSLAAKHCPSGGTAMFALLALAGDAGCVTGPTLAGIISGWFDDNLKVGLFAAILFPLLLIIGVHALRKTLSKNK